MTNRWMCLTMISSNSSMYDESNFAPFYRMKANNVFQTKISLKKDWKGKNCHDHEINFSIWKTDPGVICITLTPWRSFIITELYLLKNRSAFLIMQIRFGSDKLQIASQGFGFYVKREALFVQMRRFFVTKTVATNT